MEGVFAEAKDNHGLDRARYRGRAKMQIQAYMIAIVQNIKRMTGNGPVIEVGVEMPQLGPVAAINPFWTNIFEKLNLVFQFMKRPCLN